MVYDHKSAQCPFPTCTPPSLGPPSEAVPSNHLQPAETSVPKPVGLQVLADEMPEVNAPVHEGQMDQHVEAEDHHAAASET